MPRQDKQARAGLLHRGHIRRTRIVTPAQFCTEVL
jgi:hypothetical protein